MKNKYNTFSKNIILFSIGSFGHKILAFLLIPLYTNFLSTEEYGTIDLVTTIVNLLVPIFTLNISEAVMRFTLNDKENGSYFKLGMRVVLKGSLLLTVCLCLVMTIPFFHSYRQYVGWIFTIYIANAIYNLFQNYLRATEQIPVMVVGGLINSFVMLALDVVLITIFRLGMNGYYIAMLSGLCIAVIFMEIKAKIHKCWQTESRRNADIRSECFRYSIPTVFTALSWWINSGLDRFFVSVYCGVDQNGIYSIAYKIPTILGIFHNIFAQAWTLSAIVEFDKDDTDGFFGKTYGMYNSMMVLATSGIILFNILLSRLLYANDFFAAWRYVPMLLISSLFSALSGYYGSIFSAVKDTKTCAISTMISAGINVVLNAVFIPYIGIMGAALATAVAYFAAWGIRIVVARRYIHIRNSFLKDFLAYGLLIMQASVATTEKHFYLGQVVLLAGIVFLHYRNLYKVFVNVLKRLEGVLKRMDGK